MSTTQDTPAATRTAHKPGAAEVYEIYPGASAIVPVQPRGPRSPGDSEAGMATAEYAIATLVALVLRTRSGQV